MSTETITLIVYVAGLLFYVITFFIQRTEIKSLKSTTDQLQRFINIFDLNKVEEYVKMNEKKFEVSKEVWAHDMAKTFSDQYMKKTLLPLYDEHVKSLEQTLGQQFNEVGYFVIDALARLPEDVAETILSNDLKLCACILRPRIAEVRQWIKDHPEEKKGSL